MEKVLLTGASGYVGKVVANKLSQNNYHVIGVTRNISSKNYIEKNSISEWIECDLHRDIQQLDNYLGDVNFIVHLAGLPPKSKKLTRADYFRCNTDTIRNIASLAARYPNIKRLVHVSTIKVSGEESGGKEGRYIKEDSPFRPQDDYSESKVDAELELIKVAESNNLEYVILRPPLIFGENAGVNFVALIDLVNKKIPLPLAGVNNRRSMIYVKNFADAVLLALEKRDAKNQIYVLKDISISVPDLVRKIAGTLNIKANLFYCPVWMLKLAGILTGKRRVIQKLVESLDIDDSKIRQQLGWKPEVNFDDTLHSTVAWYLEDKKTGG